MISIPPNRLHCQCWEGDPSSASCGICQGKRGSIGGDSLPAPSDVNAPSGRYLLSASRESSASVDLSVEGTKTSSSDENSPASTMARTAARQLESHLPGQGYGEDLRKDRTRAQSRALNQRARSLIGMFGPDE